MNGVGPATIGGPGSTQASVLAQVQEAIAANLALANIAPRGVVIPGQRGAGSGGSDNPLLAGVDPVVGDIAAVEAAEREAMRCECQRLRREAMCMTTRANSFEVPVTEPGTNILPRNSQRVSIIFSVVAGVPAMFRTPDFPVGDTPFFILEVGASMQLLVRDHGPLLWEPWNALGTSAGSTVTVMETITRY